MEKHMIIYKNLQVLSTVSKWACKYITEVEITAGHTYEEGWYDSDLAIDCKIIDS